MPLDKKISELTEDTTPATTDTIPGRRGTENFRATFAQFLGAFFAANQILKADSALTPVGLTVDEQRLLGRITGGSIAGLTAAQVNTLLQTLTAAAAVTDNRIIRGDGGARGAQESAVAIDDSGNLTGLGTLNQHPLPGVGASAETGTTRSASSTDDNKVTECSNGAGCTVSINTGTAAGIWRAYRASTAGQQVTIAKGTLTTLIIPPTYQITSTTFRSLEDGAVCGVYYLSTTTGIAFGTLDPA